MQNGNRQIKRLLKAWTILVIAWAIIAVSGQAADLESIEARIAEAENAGLGTSMVHDLLEESKIAIQSGDNVSAESYVEEINQILYDAHEANKALEAVRADIVVGKEQGIDLTQILLDMEKAERLMLNENFDAAAFLAMEISAQIRRMLGEKGFATVENLRELSTYLDDAGVNSVKAGRLISLFDEAIDNGKTEAIRAALALIDSVNDSTDIVKGVAKAHIAIIKAGYASTQSLQLLETAVAHYDLGETKELEELAMEAGNFIESSQTAAELIAENSQQMNDVSLDENIRQLHDESIKNFQAGNFEASLTVALQTRESIDKQRIASIQQESTAKTALLTARFKEFQKRAISLVAMTFVAVVSIAIMLIKIRSKMAPEKKSAALRERLKKLQQDYYVHHQMSDKEYKDEFGRLQSKIARIEIKKSIKQGKKWGSPKK